MEEDKNLLIILKEISSSLKEISKNTNNTKKEKKKIDYIIIILWAILGGFCIYLFKIASDLFN